MRAEQRQFTRLRIIDASVRVFAERGYFRATVDDIAESAGITRATFYLHFKSKADLPPELLERSAALYRKMYASLGFVFSEPSFANIRDWLSRSMDEWSEVRDFIAPVMAAASVEPSVQAVVDRRGASQSDEIAQALREAIPTLKIADGQIIATILMAPWAHYLDFFLRGVPFDREKVLDTLTESWTALLASLQEKHQHS